MKLSIVLALASTAIAALEARNSCHANNCIRAVNGTRLGASFQAQATSDCSRFAIGTVTVTPTPVTVTATITPVRRVGERQAGPTDLPAYVQGKCTDVAQYASACSCIGVTVGAVTLDPVTVTVTTSAPTSTPDCNGANIQTDPNNCGTCGTVCGSGSCVDGSCSIASCVAATCGSFQSCGSPQQSCFCFSDKDNNGFCGEDAFCDSLTACESEADCGEGSFVCAFNTCCGATGVCLETVCDNPARKLVKDALRFAKGTLSADTAARRRRH